MSLIRIPSTKGLLWIGGVASAAVIGVLEAPFAIVLAALPVIDRYLANEAPPRPAAPPRSRAASRRTGGTTAGTAPRRTVRTRGTAKRTTSTRRRSSNGRRTRTST